MPMKDISVPGAPASHPELDSKRPAPASSASPNAAPIPANDSGATLAATMLFIQQTLREQGPVGWGETYNNLPGVTYRNSDAISNVVADPAACTLSTTETVDIEVDIPPTQSLKVGGNPVTADDLRSHTVETDKVSFNQIEEITVEPVQDVKTGAYAKNGHPEISVTATPNVPFILFSASNAIFSAHTSVAKGNQPVVEKDITSKTNGFPIGDLDMANRVAKALNHAMELCGGGRKGQF
jgi:hypothetical protein